MKTTIDLPNDVVRQLKLKAAHDGRKLKDVAAEAIRAGLQKKQTTKKTSRVVFYKNKISGLPMFGKPTGKKVNISPEEIAQILIDQDVEFLRGST